MAAIGALFTAAQITVITVRGDDWWPTPTTSFHFASGGSASKGQDHLLHGAISYQAARAGALLFDWACVPHETSGWLGAAFGVAIGLPKEIIDGVHEAKGFALDDFGASVAAALLPALHRSVPYTRVLAFEVFYWPSSEFRNRPSGGLPQLENDYAGQRYFLTIQPGTAPGGAGWWPDWLGVAVGHGVPQWASAPPTHDWYVTLDLRLAGLPIGGAAWHHLAGVLDQGHVPLPGLRFRQGQVAFGLF